MNFPILPVSTFQVTCQSILLALMLLIHDTAIPMSYIAYNERSIRL